MVALQSENRLGYIEGRIGTAALARAVAAGLDLTTVINALSEAAVVGPAKAAALMDLSVIEQLRGDASKGLRLQAEALEHCQVFETASDSATDFRLLVLAAPIYMGGNTPTEFLIESSRIQQTTLYLGPHLPVPDRLPDHDIMFVAAPGDVDESRPFLVHIDECLARWPGRALNDPKSIMRLERDQLSMTLRDVPNLRVPNTGRISRADLAMIGHGGLVPADLFSDLEFPLVTRPVGSHAGRNLELLRSQADVREYLGTCVDPEFFVSSYIDYRSCDGAFRKYRIVFVNGVPYACHMAIADQWKVWYMNARMEETSAKRDEERRFMKQFDSDFRSRHRETLLEMARSINLEYFGIDCAESRDGELVVFEADNALIVHDMDSVGVFPYKREQMRKIFSAFDEMLRRTSEAR